MTEEVWAAIANWPGYEVSDAGRVRSIDRLIICRDGQRQTFRGRLLSLRVGTTGYAVVHLRTPEKNSASEKVHRLVAGAFVPNPHGYPHVNHIDNDPLNNVASNLEWCTQAQNLEHARKQGRMAKYWAGRRSPNASLSPEQVTDIRTRHASGVSVAAIAADLGVARGVISKVVSGRTYQYLHPTPPSALHHGGGSQ